MLIAGGSDVKGTALKSAELFDIASATFRSAGDMSAAHSQHAAIALPDGRILIAGGKLGSATIASVDLYDPASGKFTADVNMVQTRALQTASPLPGGQVLYAGGEYVVEATFFALATAEVYTP